LYPLPDPQDFPVVAAVRLSLSFPLLLSAVPLYKIDWTRAANSSRKDPVTGVERPPVPTRVYFSDGGICSNFPIHFFDSVLPTRPTFGVHLKDFHPNRPGERLLLPAIRNNQGIQNHVPELRDEPSLKSVGGFLGSIIRTMQRWRDESQLTMPGFRDRIVHVSHDEKEGGMTLNMDAQVIGDLADDGALAAQELVNSFATPGGPGNWNAWDNHQRLRLRTLLSQLQQMLDDIDAVLRNSSPGYLAVASNDAPPSYRYPNKATRHAAQRLLTALQAMAQDLEAQGIDLKAAAPRPEPELRIVPRT
jgi:predicted acylesterase/phospholipase RssA